MNKPQKLTTNVIFDLKIKHQIIPNESDEVNQEEIDENKKTSPQAEAIITQSRPRKFSINIRLREMLAVQKTIINSKISLK